MGAARSACPAVAQNTAPLPFAPHCPEGRRPHVAHRYPFPSGRLYTARSSSFWGRPLKQNTVLIRFFQKVFRASRGRLLSGARARRYRRPSCARDCALCARARRLIAASGRHVSAAGSHDQSGAIVSTCAACDAPMLGTSGELRRSTVERRSGRGRTNGPEVRTGGRAKSGRNSPLTSRTRTNIGTTGTM